MRRGITVGKPKVVGSDVTITVVHVVGPLGTPQCPRCGSEDVIARGSWEWGPYCWECENDDCPNLKQTGLRYQWGHA